MNRRSVPRRDEYSLAARFGADTMVAGFTAVPNLVLEHYAELGLTPTEMLTVIHLWYFWWKRQDPFPSIESVAEMMGISRRQVQTYISRLRDKGLINVRHRAQRNGPSRGLRTSSAYDFSPLIQRVKEVSGIAGLEPIDDSGESEPNAAQNPAQREPDLPLHAEPDSSQPERSFLRSKDRKHSSQKEDAPKDSNEDKKALSVSESAFCGDNGEDASTDVLPTPQCAPETHAMPKSGLLDDFKADREQKASGGARTHRVAAFSIDGLSSRLIWAAVLEEIRVGPHSRALDQWLRPTSLVGLDDGAILVDVASTYAREWLEARAASVVTDALAKLIGRSLDVRFVVGGDSV
jgi:hypothetical protein